MEEKVSVKLIVVKKGVSSDEVREIIRELSQAWENACPGEKVIFVPVAQG